MKDLFAIRIGLNEKDGKYCALVKSVSDNKFAVIKKTSIRVVMAELNKLVRGKTREVKNFPMPEKSRIITLPKPNGSVLVGPNGRSLNGRS